MNCIKCRAEIPAGGIFCPFCGKKQVKEPRKALKRANGTGTVYKLQGRRRRPWVAARNRTILGYYETKTAALECGFFPYVKATRPNLLSIYNSFKISFLS